MVQSSHFQAIFALRSESRHEDKKKKIHRSKLGVINVFHVIIPKSVSGPFAATAKKETLASVFRAEQLKAWHVVCLYKL